MNIQEKKYIVIKTIICDNGLCWKKWEEKKRKKIEKKNGHVASEIYWCEINNKNKWHMYLSKGVLN